VLLSYGPLAYAREFTFEERVAAPVPGFALAPSQAWALTFEDRVEAQRAIEGVYWNHRVWPEHNPQPKPPASEVISEEILRSKVEDYLKKSNALAAVWARSITSAQLQAEMRRMARDTKAPDVLQELFAALGGNDPTLIAETLARQKLVERLVRNFYAYDGRFHGELRSVIQRALDGLGSVDDMRSLGGDYRETTWRLSTDFGVTEGAATGDGEHSIVQLDAQQWEEHVEDVAARFDEQPGSLSAGRVSPLEETTESFLVTAVLSTTAGEITTATVTWSKAPLDSWWLTEREKHGTVLTGGSGRHEPALPQVRACLDDTWRKTFDGEVPDPRSGHTAVWTGSEMIVWGGDSNTGGRYDPSTDTWSSTSRGAGVPPVSFSYHPTAIWTGSEMIVWGGDSNTGGRYNPSTDTWTPTSTGPGVPSARRDHTAVWTGTEMIVWGGSVPGLSSTGGRYNPSTDTWTPTSTGPDLPAARRYHTAVWTGHEMIVWGGDANPFLFSQGGRYDPSTDTWAALSLGVNFSRERHTAVWTGREMIVWGGVGSTFQNPMDSGGRYDPSTDTWATTSTSTGAPSARVAHEAVWTGREMIVWGGFGSGSIAVGSGARYDPSTDTWVATSTSSGVPWARGSHTAIWTGTEMIVWGGFDGRQLVGTGGRYDPSTDTWVATAMGAGVPSARFGHQAVWTGSEMVVWGGGSSTGGRYDPATDSWAAMSTAAGVSSGGTTVWTGREMIVWGATGGRYDPATDTWAAMSTGPGVSSQGTAVWTGREMIVWGGFGPGGSGSNTGARYDPETDTWVTTSTAAGVPSARLFHTAVWTGSEMIVWGGIANIFSSFRLNTGGRYDPAADSWLPTSTGAGVPWARQEHTALWTGTEMIVWGGNAFALSIAGGRYDPVTDTWVPTSTGPGVPSERLYHTAVWTGREMIIWGGRGSDYLDTGGRYDPASDTWVVTSTGTGVPSARRHHSAVWTGREMIVWGGDPAAASGGAYCAFGGCIGSPAVCDDGDACTLDACDVGTNECTSDPIVCDTGGACSIGECDPASGCRYVVHDADGDAVCDDADSCPVSNLAPTVVLRACDSQVSNELFPDGCTIADRISACDDLLRHGRFVSCVARITNELKERGVITGEQKGWLQSCAARTTATDRRIPKASGPICVP